MPNLLIAIKNAIIRETVSMFLRDVGFTITTAKDGAEAIYQIKTFLETTMQFDLLVIDFNLDALHGFDLCDECSRLNIETPILAVASENDQKLITHLQEKGFDEILIIPFGLNEIYAKILGLLTTNRVLNKHHF